MCRIPESQHESHGVAVSYGSSKTVIRLAFLAKNCLIALLESIEYFSVILTNLVVQDIGI
jgi:hypothetical protein